ncbi:hypothetical protein ACIGG5_05630 [Streptomyces sp. NPDC085463]|uniref:hypothetical protein n=1 Tax=Streptomyces sp. NPDC085463 TaxID=3365724 RepID=UPI0037D654DD
MGKEVRRAAGTQTFTDLLRNPKRIIDQFKAKASMRTEEDIAALNAGEARTVSAFIRNEGVFLRGELTLDLTAPFPAIWSPIRPFRQAEQIPLIPPFRVYNTGPVNGEGAQAIDRTMFRLISLQDSNRSWEIAVPTIDVPLVRSALSRNF